MVSEKVVLMEEQEASAGHCSVLLLGMMMEVLHSGLLYFGKHGIRLSIWMASRKVEEAAAVATEVSLDVLIPFSIITATSQLTGDESLKLEGQILGGVPL